MPSTRALPFAGIIVGALALAGCIATPPAIAPQQTTPATAPTTAPSSPQPTAAAPSSTPDATPTDPAPATGASTVTIDGQAVGSWGGTLACVSYGDGALVTSDSADPTGTLVGSATVANGTWSVSGFLVSNGDDVYFQTDETSPATFDGGTLSAQIAVSDFAGGSATIAFSVPC